MMANAFTLFLGREAALCEDKGRPLLTGSQPDMCFLPHHRLQELLYSPLLMRAGIMNGFEVKTMYVSAANYDVHVDFVWVLFQFMQNEYRQVAA